MEDERTTLVRRFYQLYRPLQAGHGLRMNSHLALYGDSIIEIWEYEGERKKRCICRVKEKRELDCWRRAVQMLEQHSRKGKA